MVRRETELYPPVKRLLEARGYSVRAEVEGCDAVGMRGDDVVVVELKRSFGVGVLIQALDRLPLTDTVYVAVPEPARGLPGMTRLCRALGIGLITVRSGRAQVQADPQPWRPRANRRRKERLLGEFSRRSADHNTGGSSRQPIVTAYREDALRCAQALAGGATSVAEVRRRSGVERAGAILYRDVYGWFERPGRGTYRLSSKGAKALEDFAAVLAETAPALRP